MTVPTTAPSTETVTVLPASAVPLIAGVGLLIEAPFAGALTTGAAGAVVSTVKGTAAELGEVLPAASVAVALALCAPSARVWLAPSV